MPRLFAALRPPTAICDLLNGVQEGVEGARWQCDDQLHLTLRYIGEVDRRMANDIADALSVIRSRAFTIAISGVGSFDRKGRIDSLWAGVAPAAPLEALHKKIDHALVCLGLPPEGRAYKPHITLARGRMGPVGPYLAQHSALSSVPFRLDAFGLYESILRDEGSLYREVVRFPLEQEIDQ